MHDVDGDKHSSRLSSRNLGCNKRRQRQQHHHHHHNHHPRHSPATKPQLRINVALRLVRLSKAPCGWRLRLIGPNLSRRLRSLLLSRFDDERTRVMEDMRSSME
ncbi:MAG: hypothetical protein FE78DRAFT_268316 [Acidomyces sp. 'richmondensis']|nr:MAG: hypothetical protein FE78DRAFT_268316 [Acidomyces sp. 'richmondensis']